MQKINVQAGFTPERTAGFCVQFLPDSTPRGQIIYLPPFTEEMNRCRCSVATQARWFAEQGFGVSLLDFFGTGESEGTLETASLSIWLDNIESLIRTINAQQSAPIYLWGCRLGALIGLQYMASRDSGVKGSIFWQPVTSGKSFVTQILRQRIASLMEKGEEAETTTSIRQRLHAGECIEVGGYILGGRLMAELDALDVSSNLPLAPTTIYWLEHSLDPSLPIGIKSQKAIDLLTANGSEVESSVFSGPPVWQLHERDTCEELLLKTQAIAL